MGVTFLSSSFGIVVEAFSQQTSSSSHRHPEAQNHSPPPSNNNNNNNEEVKELKQWSKVKIEYEYANQFYRENYGGKIPYFPKKTGLDTVYDARHGVLINNNNKKIGTASLEGSGFEVCTLPTKCKDFKDKKQIAKHYLPELRSVLEQRYQQPITPRNSFFWYGKIRGEDYDQTLRRDCYATNPVMPLVHIDANLDNYSTKDLIYQLTKTATKRRIPEDQDFDVDMFQKAISQNQQRFLLINFWRSLGKDPVRRAPLGILQSRYAQEGMSFPRARIDQTQSHWYVFPEMTHDECLIFKQYDRRLDQPSDLWHAAMEPRYQPRNVEQRLSFDIRALVVLDEVVPDKWNRFDATMK